MRFDHPDEQCRDDRASCRCYLVQHTGTQVIGAATRQGKGAGLPDAYITLRYIAIFIVTLAVNLLEALHCNALSADFIGRHPQLAGDNSREERKSMIVDIFPSALPIWPPYMQAKIVSF